MGLGTTPARTIPPGTVEDLIDDLKAWTAATHDGTDTIGTVELQLTRAQTDRLRWIVKADTKRLATPKPDQG